ncbi:hypothetical protein BDZ89DRAFT_1223059 [Hymenopellis radicata]|nr:hypothetical protein BDZ89DRAFT_1223059 [Hymenopellis radicata]
MPGKLGVSAPLAAMGKPRAPESDPKCRLLTAFRQITQSCANPVFSAHFHQAFLLREILSSPDSRITGYGLPDSVLLDGSSRGSLYLPSWDLRPQAPFQLTLARSSSTAPKTRLYRPTHKTSSLLLHMAALAVSFEPSSTGLYDQTTKWSGFNNEMVRI